MPAKPVRSGKTVPQRKAAQAKAPRGKRTHAGTAQAKPTAKPATSSRSAAAARDIGALNGHLGYFVRRLQIWVFQDFIRTLSPLEISPAQFSVLAVIHANEGLSQAELGHTLAIERARLVRLLDRLQRRDLLERLPSSADGRRHALRLTPSGQSTLKQARALAERHEAGLLTKLGETRYRALMDALRS
ncbi:MAG: MarR family winged helix-turn-helix transcriptional regulator [Pseudolabrys sp.]|jgi:DNA-binding MarR family transcriptional regulator